jgi:hypothetical protein
VQARRRVEAISWALNLAPVPVDRGGQPSSACKFVLVGLANHAGPDGTGAFPSVATLVRYTGLSERTVRMCLDRLEAAGIVSPCDPGIVAVRIKRADPRPQGWHLNLSLVRDDLDDAAIAILEHQFPGLTADQRARLAPAVQAALDAGWLPQALATFTGANTVGVRSPYAVLAARLSPAELPPQQRQRPARPPWCGECDEVTRMLGSTVTRHVRARAASGGPQRAVRQDVITDRYRATYDKP